MKVWTVYESPLGPLTLTGGPAGLTGLWFPGRSGPRDEAARDEAPFADAVAQLAAYFAGEATSFDLAVDLRGTPFQQDVWALLRGIPHGRTTTYGSLALALGRPERVRAVGAAVGRTPVPIIVPCHRVIGVNGDLTGYGGGLQRKRALLDLEAAVAGGQPLPEVWRGRQMSLL